uniref:Carboxylesterase type B domain-containing protein n=1 Tax=Plectus sambesii TaxID=2011161 RepID=A0A914ULW7_9BILA
CLRSISVSEIQTAWGGWDGLHRWAPVGDNYVFPDHVENLVLKRGPMPLLIGNCKDEQLLRYMDQLQQDPHFLNEWTRQSTAQHFSSLFELKFYNNSALVRQQGLDAYVNSLPYADQDHVSWVLDSIQLDSEMIFIGPTYREAMNFRHVGSPVYLYSFDYLAPGAMPLLNASFRGVPHTWELQYLFGFPGTSEGGWQVTSDDIATMNNFGLYWANFVNYGNPTPASSATIWPQLGTNGEYMIIGPAPRPATNFHPKAATFWACTVPTTEGYRPAWCP